MRELVRVCAFMVLVSTTHIPLQGGARVQRRVAFAQGKAENSLKAFLRNYLGDEDRAVRYIPAFVDLNGDGTPEAIVYIIGRGWCGSGGCTMLVLTPKDTSYRIVTKVTIARPPVRVLAGKSNGWRNITVLVQGGGIEPPYEAELRFDGKTYPSNPSVPPARPLHGKVAGEVVVASLEEGKPLYP